MFCTDYSEFPSDLPKSESGPETLAVSLLLSSEGTYMLIFLLIMYFDDEKLESSLIIFSVNGLQYGFA